MNKLPVLLMLVFAISPVLAVCGDHICTKGEYGTSCIDCRAHAPGKNWCVNDGICTNIEDAHNCADCQSKGGSFSGLATFTWGFSALAMVAVLAITLFLVYIVFSDKVRAMRRTKL
ncbi:MAG: hypothetical protein J7L23_03855 [Candidatus Diapherotrites archaeon]|nr:hypothetical protein [Candidatus Diapherotrites archaeon]